MNNLKCKTFNTTTADAHDAAFLAFVNTLTAQNKVLNIVHVAAPSFRTGRIVQTIYYFTIDNPVRQ
jgi:hypothetical protein